MDRIRLRGKACQCVACGKVFTSESGFNRHRYGTYEAGRVCRTTSELEKAGWTLKRPNLTHWMLPGPPK